ncbi:MAG TPA: hypothetical protein EYH56_01560 [Nanoarchaeota archaeon]|nr:hypothetical protein [Nanoarchaeota archaeon]
MKIGLAALSKEKIEKIMEELKNLGVEALPINASEIILYAGKGIGAFYRGVNFFDLDGIVIFPEIRQFEFFYKLLRICEDFIPVSIPSDKFLFFYNRALLQRFLSMNGIPVRKIYIFSEVTAANIVLKKLKLPVILQFTDGKRILVRNEETFRDIISNTETNTVITAEKPVNPSHIIKAIVVGEEVIAYEKSDNEIKSIQASKEIIDLSLKIKNLFSSYFLKITFVPYKKSYFVNEVSFDLEIESFEKITGKNIAKMLAENIIKEIKEGKKHIVKQSIGKSFEGIVRWLSEIGIIRS